jgi:hypothetical protein
LLLDLIYSEILLVLVHSSEDIRYIIPQSHKKVLIRFHPFDPPINPRYEKKNEIQVL